MKKDLYSEKQLFELFTKSKMQSLFPGEWQSILKGSGYEFWDLREYQPGDAYKKIHWKQTAKTGKLHVKEHLAESYASVMLLYDISKSVAFEKKEALQAVISASLAYSALRGNNSCGMIMFSDRVDKYIPPKSGKLQLRDIITALQNTSPKDCGETNISEALQLLMNKVPRSLSFIISDFNAHEGYRNVLDKIDKTSHDIVALIVVAKSELELPREGCILEVTDCEKGGSFVLDAEAYAKVYHQKMVEEKQKVKKVLENRGVDSEIITTSESFIQKIRVLLKKRKEKTR